MRRLEDRQDVRLGIEDVLVEGDVGRIIKQEVKVFYRCQRRQSSPGKQKQY